MFSKTCLKGHSKIDTTNISMTNGSLMKVKSIAECSKGSILQYFDLHLAIIGLETQFSVVLKVAVLHWFYCMWNGISYLIANYPSRLFRGCSSIVEIKLLFA